MSRNEPGHLRHLAISPDGNRRWALRHGRAKTAGYSAALDVLPGIVGTALDHGIEYLSLHTMNHLSWSRPKHELDAVMATVAHFISDLAGRAVHGEVSLAWVGCRNRVPDELRRQIEEVERASSPTALLCIALYLDYDAEQHVADAGGRMDALEPRGFPPVDLYIRTSENFRTSGFDPLRVMHAELLFAPGGFPAFTADRLAGCLTEFQGRARTFGQ